MGLDFEQLKADGHQEHRMALDQILNTSKHIRFKIFRNIGFFGFSGTVSFLMLFIL